MNRENKIKKKRRKEIVENLRVIKFILTLFFAISHIIIMIDYNTKREGITSLPFEKLPAS
ncbi:MAG: hypothetical protein AB1410_10915 [Acidobacteriota bacterium]